MLPCQDLSLGSNYRWLERCWLQSRSLATKSFNLLWQSNDKMTGHLTTWLSRHVGRISLSPWLFTGVESCVGKASHQVKQGGWEGLKKGECDRRKLAALLCGSPGGKAVSFAISYSAAISQRWRVCAFSLCGVVLYNACPGYF